MSFSHKHYSGLIPLFPKKNGLKKRHMYGPYLAKISTKPGEREKRMYEHSPHMISYPEPHPEHYPQPGPANMKDCPMKSMLGIDRQKRPFTCQMRQVPLLGMIGLFSLFFSCLLSCCCCRMCRCFFRWICCKNHDSRDNISSSKRDVVMIRA